MELFVHELAFIDDCLALAAKQVEYLGVRAPQGIEDASVRDIACDAFEFLYEAKRALVRNQSSVLFPLMRRAFESISLVHLFSRKPEFAKKWAAGREISNTEVRKALENDPMTDSIEEVKAMYKHFSQGTHPNRSHVPFMFLGEGNQFTLGGIHPIDPYSLGTQVRYLMQLCYWYIGVLLWNYRDSMLDKNRKDFAEEMLALTPRRKALRKILDAQIKRLASEVEEEGPPRGIGPAYISTKT
jgi:hypothetical protein